MVAYNESNKLQKAYVKLDFPGEPVNEAPVFNSVSTIEKEYLLGKTFDVTINAKDPEGKPLNYKVYVIEKNDEILIKIETEYPTWVYIDGSAIAYNAAALASLLTASAIYTTASLSATFLSAFACASSKTPGLKVITPRPSYSYWSGVNPNVLINSFAWSLAFFTASLYSSVPSFNSL